MKIVSPTGAQFEVGNLIGEDGEGRYKLYLASGTDGRECVLKIATGVEHNGSLDREAFQLKNLKEAAARLEAEYEKVKKNPKEVLNYQFFFPDLVESFVDADQGGRRISILSFASIADKVGELAPLAFITERDGERVDPKTSAWMLGKLLKMLAFAHSEGVTVGDLSAGNILANRHRHIVSVFDWSQAKIWDTPISREVASDEIAAVAQAVLEALGGDLLTGTLPEDEQLPDDRYEKLIWRFACGRERDAFRAHQEFYKLIMELWPKKEFHKYRAYPL